MFLALPMMLAKHLNIDTNQVVTLLPYLTHALLVILNDLFFWKVAKRIVGRDAARFSLILFFFNRFQTMHMIRTLTNSIEQVFTVVAFYFYIDQKNKFNLNTVILTALISIAFMMRNTSPVGWIPLLAIKVLKEGALLPFILSGVFVALPILMFCVWVDTTMYKADDWVLTGYNFFEMNILHGLSKYFGEDGPFYYFIVALPSIFIVLVPTAFVSIISHLKF